MRVYSPQESFWCTQRKFHSVFAAHLGHWKSYKKTNVNWLEDNSLFSSDVNKIRTVQTLLTASTAHCGFFVKIVFRRVLEECRISHVDKSCFLVAQLAIFSLRPVWCGSVNGNRKLITYLQSSIQNCFLISNTPVQRFY